MSLKAFHFVFIFLATLVAISLGAWCVWINLIEGAPVYLAGAVACFLSAVGLLIYGAWFYKKMKRLGIIT